MMILLPNLFYRGEPCRIGLLSPVSRVCFLVAEFAPGDDFLDIKSSSHGLSIPVKALNVDGLFWYWNYKFPL